MYNQDYMDDNETLSKEDVHQIVRQTPLFLGLKLVVLELVFSGIYLLLRLPLHFFEFDIPFVDETFLFYAIVFTIFTLIEVAIILWPLLQWANEYYEITHGEITHHKGVFSRSQQIYSLDNIEAITIEQGFLGRLLHYGTIKLVNPVLNQEIYLYLISQPEKYLEVIQKQIDKPAEGKGVFIRR